MDKYEEALEKMAQAMWRLSDEYRAPAASMSDCRISARAAAEAIGLREMMERLDEPFLPDMPPPELPDPNYVFECPINFPGCVENCGNYGCGN